MIFIIDDLSSLVALSEDLNIFATDQSQFNVSSSGSADSISDNSAFPNQAPEFINTDFTSPLICEQPKSFLPANPTSLSLASGTDFKSSTNQICTDQLISSSSPSSSTNQIASMNQNPSNLPAPNPLAGLPQQSVVTPVSQSVNQTSVNTQSAGLQASNVVPPLPPTSVTVNPMSGVNPQGVPVNTNQPTNTMSQPSAILTSTNPVPLLASVNQFPGIKPQSAPGTPIAGVPPMIHLTGLGPTGPLNRLITANPSQITLNQSQFQQATSPAVVAQQPRLPTVSGVQLPGQGQTILKPTQASQPATLNLSNLYAGNGGAILNVSQGLLNQPVQVSGFKCVTQALLHRSKLIFEICE